MIFKMVIKNTTLVPPFQGVLCNKAESNNSRPLANSARRSFSLSIILKIGEFGSKSKRNITPKGKAPGVFLQ
jgi:hypothetical protein